MLRGLAAALLLANAGYLAWTHGWLYQVGLFPSPQPHTEPARIAQQLRAEYIELIREPKAAPSQVGTPNHTEPTPLPSPVAPAANAAEAPAATTDNAPTAASADTPAAEPTRCAQLSGTLTDKQFAALRAAMTGVLPDNAWAVSTAVQPPRWIVYSGKLAGADTLAARKAELKQLQVEFRDVSLASLQPGLAMGTYSTEAGAQQALRDVTKAGVKGAKVVIERPEATLYTFKLPEATEPIQARFKQLMDRLPPDTLKGKTLQACS